MPSVIWPLSTHPSSHKRATLHGEFYFVILVYRSKLDLDSLYPHPPSLPSLHSSNNVSDCGILGQIGQPMLDPSQEPWFVCWKHYGLWHPRLIKSTCKKERFTAHYETWDQLYIDHVVMWQIHRTIIQQYNGLFWTLIVEGKTHIIHQKLEKGPFTTPS
jgi:hypothetical protein